MVNVEDSKKKKKTDFVENNEIKVVRGKPVAYFIIDFMGSYG